MLNKQRVGRKYVLSNARMRRYSTNSFSRGQFDGCEQLNQPYRIGITAIVSGGLYCQSVSFRKFDFRDPSDNRVFFTLNQDELAYLGSPQKTENKAR